MWHKNNIIKALKDNFLESKIDEHLQASQVIIDSRQKSENGLFIAIKGDNNDGHNYLKNAFDNGAIMAIIDKIPEGFENDNRLILTKNSNQALLDLAHYSRAIFTGKIIGVTGSVGKTSVKEMLKTILSYKHKTFATQGNLNNHIGMPLTLCNLDSSYEYAILEMGMNHLGEIDFLSKMAKPQIAIISTVTSAHIANFKNEEEIALAKSEIFHGLVQNGHAIINGDNKHYQFVKNQAHQNNVKDNNIISFGKNDYNQTQLISFNHIDENFSQVKVKISQKIFDYQINSINEATIFNSLIILSTLKALNLNIENYLPAFNQLTTPKGRGNIIKIDKPNLKLTIIDDSYNANLTSMIAGLKFLHDVRKINPNSRIVAIIGDMLELGKYEVEEHKSIAKYIREFNIDKVLLVGPLTHNMISDLESEKLIGHFANSKDLADKINNLVKNNDIILVKGSRGTRMELIINKLNES